MNKIEEPTFYVYKPEDLQNLTNTTAIIQPEYVFKSEYLKHYEKWVRETCIYSSTTMICENPEFDWLVKHAKANLQSIKEILGFDASPLVWVMSNAFGFHFPLYNCGRMGWMTRWWLHWVSAKIEDLKATDSYLTYSYF